MAVGNAAVGAAFPGTARGGASLALKLAGYRFAPSRLPTAVTVVLFALLCSLGFWQLERATGKEERREVFEAARSVRLDGSALGRAPYEYAQVDLEGRYDPSRQFLQDNRTHHGRAGYHVLTPFRVEGHGAVLINRGWVPAEGDRARLPRVSAPGDILRLRGRVRLPREDLFVLGETGYDARGWPRVVQRVEIDAMQRVLGYPLASWIVQLDPAAPHGFLRAWKVAPGLSPERHRGYAFQWFALATALLAIWVVVNLKRTPS